MTTSNSILSYFPKGMIPRDVQVEALEFIEENYWKNDVLVLNLPVASGKSLIAQTLQAWAGAGTSCILTNNNILVEQYKKDFPTLPACFGKSAVKCLNQVEQDVTWGSCAERYDWAFKNKKRKYCPDCPYYKGERRFRTPSKFNYVTNYYKYVNLKGQYYRAAREILIIDEAHNLSSAIKMFNSKQIWKHDFNYEKCLDRYGRIDRTKLLELCKLNTEFKNPGSWFINELTTEPKYIFKADSELYRGELKDCLVAEPVDIRGLDNPIFNTNNKIILMSATINKNDIIELGLDKRRVAYHEANSCIPKERRPIYFEPVGKIRGQDIKASAELIQHKINNLLERYPKDKGLIHATYAQANILRYLFKDNPRILFHDKLNKTEQYQAFRQDTTGKVLVASGLYEGIDLPDDLGRWQALAKVPWPNKGEPAIAYVSDLDPNWYTWQTAKQVLQACGRISRHPEDQGDTFILDSTFKSLYINNQDYWPRWWKESLHGI